MSWVLCILGSNFTINCMLKIRKLQLTIQELKYLCMVN
jgi:hypothetical protein